MVGDVNIFLNGSLESLRLPFKQSNENGEEEDEGYAEVEVMIAGAKKRVLFPHPHADYICQNHHIVDEATLVKRCG